MGCACKGKKNVNSVKTPIRSSNPNSNGKRLNTSSNRIIRREIK